MRTARKGVPGRGQLAGSGDSAQLGRRQSVQGAEERAHPISVPTGVGAQKSGFCLALKEQMCFRKQGFLGYHEQPKISLGWQGNTASSRAESHQEVRK